MKRPGTLNAFTKFILTAGILYLFLFFIYQFIVKRYTFYDQAFIGHIIICAEWFLNVIGYDTFTVLQDRDVQVIGIDGSNGVWVGSNCNAIKLFGLFAVFVIAYPGSQKNKWWYVPAGIVAIHLLNIFRVAALAIIANHDYTWLDFNHTYTFTFIVYGFIFFLWILWVNRFSVTATVNEQAKN
jgi:exosortase family protein XrtF